MKDINNDQAKFRIGSKSLLSAVNMARKVIVSKPVIPALENLHISVKDNRLTVTASDTETTISVGRDIVAGGYSGEFMVMPDFLTVALKGLVFPPLDFTVAGGRVDVSWDGGMLSGPSIDIADWPATEGLNGEIETATFDSAELLHCLSLVEYAVSTEEIRPVLCGVRFELDGASGLTLIGSDAHRLACSRVKGSSSFRAFGFTLPRRCVGFLKSVLSTPGVVSLTCDGQYAIFEHEEALTTVRCRLIEGKFPNWRQLIPGSFSVAADISKEPLLQSLVRLTVASGVSRAVVLSFVQGASEVFSRDLGLSIEASEKLDCELVKGQGVDICFRLEYLRSVIEKMPGSRLRLLFNEPTKAVFVIEAEETKKGEGVPMGVQDVPVFALVMPIIDPFA